MTRKRARNDKGHFVGDDKSTPYLNEAYEVTFGEKVRQFFWIPPNETVLGYLGRFVKWIFVG